jgi:hypothetical protein
MHDGAERVRHRKTHRPNLDSFSHIPLPEDNTSTSSPSQAHRHAQRPSLTSSCTSSSSPSWKTQFHLFLHRLFSFPHPGRKRRILLALISGIVLLSPINDVLFGYKKLHGTYSKHGKSMLQQQDEGKKKSRTDKRMRKKEGGAESGSMKQYSRLPILAT